MWAPFGLEQHWRLSPSSRVICVVSDVEESEYDLGTTSVRLFRVGNIIQILFSKKLDARFLYADVAAILKKREEEFRDR